MAPSTEWASREVMSAGEAQQRLRQFSKTKLCKFELLGMCTKGPRCAFAHSQVEMRPLPDLRRTKLCSSVMQAGRCDKEGCTFAHSKEELRSTGVFHKTKLCRFVQNGHCSLGARCNFAHSLEEVRMAESVLGQYEANDAPAPVWFEAEAASIAAPPASAVPQGRRVQFKVPPGVPQAVPVGADALVGEGGLRGGRLHPFADAWPSRVGFSSLVPVPLGEPAYVPITGGVVVDQSENSWKAFPAPWAGARRASMRTVRTSESTLCSLGDYFEGLDGGYAALSLPPPAPVHL